jgi:type IV pilus assembly protein PilW
MMKNDHHQAMRVIKPYPQPSSNAWSGWGGWRDDKGFTLIELLAGIVITLVVVAAGFTILITSNKATMTNDQVAETQQNARVAMDLISRDIKLAGFGFSGSTAGNCQIGTNNVPIVPLDHANEPDKGPDQVRLVVPVTNTTWTLANQVTGGVTANVIVLQAGAGTDMVSAGLVTGTVSGSTISIGGVISAKVTARTNDQLTIETPIGQGVFTVGTPVYLLQCVTYAIANGNPPCGGNGPCLTRNGVAIADGIEDLQLAYGCDGCVSTINGGVPDGVIDNQDAVPGFNTGDLITNNNWAASPLVPASIRLVQINVVARQMSPEQGLGELNAPGTNTAGPIVVSNHNPSNDAGYNATTYSQLRRRLITRTVQVRNLGL